MAEGKAMKCAMMVTIIRMLGLLRANAVQAVWANLDFVGMVSSKLRMVRPATMVTGSEIDVLTVLSLARSAYLIAHWGMAAFIDVATAL